MPIPEAETKLTIKQLRKARRDAFFKMNVDLGKSVKDMLAVVEADKLEEILTAYISIMSHEKGEEDTIEVDVYVMQQMAFLASLSMSRILCDRYK